jgi:hypothetical protein
VRAQDIEVEWEAPANAAGPELMGRYVPRKMGTYSVSVTYKGMHVKGSPWPLRVVPDAGRAARSTISGLPSHLAAGTPSKVKLVAKDAYGNLTTGGDAVAIVVDSVIEGDCIARAQVHLTRSPRFGPPSGYPSPPHVLMRGGGLIINGLLPSLYYAACSIG